MADAPPYPHELEHDATLPDGTRVHIRPIRPDDAERLVAFYLTLSRHTAYQRFFTVMRRLPPDWARVLATVDYRRRLALTAEIETPRGMELLGVARYEPSDHEETAEVAFVVHDGWQGRGLGTILLGDLLRAAEARGIHRFRAYVLTDNYRMLGLLARQTDVEERKSDLGVAEIVFRPKTARAPATPS